MKRILTLFVLLLGSFAANAQFYDNGADPSFIQWWSIDTPSYRIIYPQGADSLARVYGTTLENYRVGAGASLGIGAGMGTKFPVVLHTRNPYSNGSVSWAPRRMDLYTVPQAYTPDPSPWPVQLSSHEPRHQAQLAFSAHEYFKVGSWLIGEAFNPVAWALFLDTSIGEGDAVATETSIALGTRARTSDFLDYYRVATGEGHSRSWNQWRYGSFKRVTPDYYATGYLTVAGARLFKDSLAVKHAMENARKKPWMFAQYSLGAKESFAAGLEEYARIWKEDRDVRAPFMPLGEIISPSHKYPVEYSGLQIYGGDLYAIQRGNTITPQLVVFREGKWKVLRPFSSQVSNLFPDEDGGRFIWSETIPGSRWDHDGKSVVRYMAPGEPSHIHTLTKGFSGRYYTPYLRGDGTALAVTEYPFDGSAAVAILSPEDGSVIRRFKAPDGLQPTECVWLEGRLYVLGLSEQGFSVYEPGVWEPLFEPLRCRLWSFGDNDGHLEFLSDLNGVNEFYHWTPGEDHFIRMTNTPYGLQDFVTDGEYAYMVFTTVDGTEVRRLPQSSLSPVEVPIAVTARYPVEDALTRQEGLVEAFTPVEFTEPVRYYKIGHPARLHSWAPAYLDYDAVKEGSFDFSYETLSPGLTAFFQNTLSTLSGSLGYSFAPDEDGVWGHSLHGKLVFSGWYPVIEASFDLGGGAASQYVLKRTTAGGVTASQIAAVPSSRVGASATLEAYLPFRFASGGLIKGFIPRVRYSVSNSGFSTSFWDFTAPPFFFEGVPAHYSFSGFSDGSNKYLQSLNVSARGYLMLPSAESRAYPKWGIGAEAGYSVRPGLTGVFYPNAYAYIYGYVPGAFETHGLRLSALFQQRLGSDSIFGELSVNTAPRGFGATPSIIMARVNPIQLKFTADYSVPFYLGDLSLMPVSYVKHFTITPHFDFTVMGDGSFKSLSRNLWSVGADLTASLANVLFLSFDTSVGVSFSYLGGSWFSSSTQPSNYFLGPVFSMSF